MDLIKTPWHVIATGGLMTFVVMSCLYQSLGWIHTPTWLTKKVMVDTMQSMGPSTFVLSMGALLGCATSVAYTVVLTIVPRLLMHDT